MTRNEARKAAEVMLAYAEGKEIQFRFRGKDRWWEIEEGDGRSINLDNYEYRIKPEPKYRPFKDAEECWQEMQKHQPFGWLKRKEDGGHCIQLTTLDNGDLCVIGMNDGWDLEGLSKSFTFADGTPFGVKEGEA